MMRRVVPRDAWCPESRGAPNVCVLFIIYHYIQPNGHGLSGCFVDLPKPPDSLEFTFRKLFYFFLILILLPIFGVLAKKSRAHARTRELPI